MLIQWNDINSVNIKEIDEQHEKIVGIINNLSEINKEEERDVENIKTIVDELRQYISVHLATEEKYFKKYQYPSAVEHVKIHQDFRSKVAEFDESIKKGINQEEIISEMLKFLGDWWINHINKIDMQYSDYLNQKGLY